MRTAKAFKADARAYEESKKIEEFEKQLAQLKNSEKIAEEIYKLENTIGGYAGFVNPAGSMEIIINDDGMAWYVKLRRMDQERPFYKVVPCYMLDEETIEEILKVQPWVCL